MRTEEEEEHSFSCQYVVFGCCDMAVSCYLLNQLLCFYNELRVFFPFLCPSRFYFGLHGLFRFQSLPCLMLLLTSSLPGFASSYIACFVSGPPGPSKSRALVGLGEITSQLPLFPFKNPPTDFYFEPAGVYGSTYWPDPPFSPGLEIISPPSSTGISRLSPAPEAAEPTLIVLPGNLFVTLVSTPDSVAGREALAVCAGE